MVNQNNARELCPRSFSLEEQTSLFSFYPSPIGLVAGERRLLSLSTINEAHLFLN